MKSTSQCAGDGVQTGKARRFWIELRDLNWWVVLLLYTLGALISASTFYTTELAEHRYIPYAYPLLTEFTGYYAQMALLPLVILGFGRFPICRANWFWTVPLLLVFSMVLGVIHTELMFGSRRALYALLGLGTYDYGQMGYRFLMEYHKQFLHFWGVYVLLRFVAHYRESREREREAAALQLKTSELQKELAQAQIQALRSQLNPHFLFNTLHMISSVMYEDLGRADQMLGTLGRMLRMSLEENADARVPVRRELEFVQCAVDLVRARFQDKVEIVVDCGPDALDRLMPNLLLYTLIENSIKHHDFDLDPVIRIGATVRTTGNSLVIEVVDNGPGIADLEKAETRGVGLSNTRGRLRALYGDNHRLELLNRPGGGLQVQVVLPLESALPKPPPASTLPGEGARVEREFRARVQGGEPLGQTPALRP